MIDLMDWREWGFSEPEAQELYEFAQKGARALVWNLDIRADVAQQMLWACFSCLHSPPPDLPQDQHEKIAFLKDRMFIAGREMRDQFDG